MKNILTHLKQQGMSERILFSLSALLFLFVTPPTIIRLINQDWAIFILDLFLVSSAAFIFLNTYRGKYLTFLKFYMCCLVSTGASLTVIFGGIEQVYWIYPTTLTAFFLVKHRFAFGFTVAISVAIAPTVYLGASGAMHIITIYFALFGTAAFISAFSQEIISENESLNTLATIDPLTGTGNRRLFEEEASNCLIASENNNKTNALIVIDIDDFKNLNDTRGHLLGDQVLKHLSRIIKTRLVNDAGIYRLGGEEFAVIVPGHKLNEGVNFAELIQFLIANELDSDLPNYTVSMGVAVLRPGESINDWLNRADAAMYTAKRSGKNQIVNAEDLSNEENVTRLNERLSSIAKRVT